MKRLVLSAVVLGVGLMAESAQAQRLEAAARLGYQLPTGKLAEVPPESTSADAFDINDSVTGQIPIGLELGARIVPMLALGAYVDFAPGILSSELSDDCEALDHDCVAVGFHIGVMIHLHFRPEASVDPWFGAGVGGEGLALGEDDGINQLIASFGGVEFPLRAGLDFKLAKRFSLGPYVGYTFGTFSSAALRCEGPGCEFSEIEEDIEETAAHGWFGFGAKLTILAL